VKLLRFLVSSIWLVGTLLLATVDLFVVALRHGFHPSSHARSLWLQRNSRRVVKVIVAECDASSVRLGAGLLVCNHVSYVDILVLGSIAPAVFVAKSEVAKWPVFGWFARGCGTIFVRRELRSDVTRISDEIRNRLQRGFLVVLFPEGTSSDGGEVLPFKSSLLEPVRAVGRDVYAAHVSYVQRDGTPGTNVPYWGEMTMLPHLLRLLSQPRVKARVGLRAVKELPDCRKELARQLQAEVTQLGKPE
jgi:1-acyl-sn-glycerol-3-phosphate acyltransferase